MLIGTTTRSHTSFSVANQAVFNGILDEARAILEMIARVVRT